MLKSNDLYTAVLKSWEAPFEFCFIHLGRVVNTSKPQTNIDALEAIEGRLLLKDSLLTSMQKT